MTSHRIDPKAVCGGIALAGCWKSIHLRAPVLRDAGIMATAVLCTLLSVIPASAQPTWTSTFVSGSTGNLEKYQSGTATYTTGATLSSYNPFSFTSGVHTGASTDNTGGKNGDGCTYPSGPPWWSTLPANRQDKTGAFLSRDPQIGMRSNALTGVKGLYYDGTFGGNVSLSSGATFLEAVYFHEQQCYAGYSEYGFYLTPSGTSPSLIFYWSTKSNCGGNASVEPYCTTNQVTGGNPTGTADIYEDTANDGDPQSDQQSHGISISLPGSYSPGDELQCTAFIFQDGDGYWKFKVRVYDVTISTVAYPSSGTYGVVDPNTNHGYLWYPADLLYGANGYLTFGLVWTDPFTCGGGGSSCISVSSTPSINVTSVQYGQ
jgi:hypothetical protein